MGKIISQFLSTPTAQNIVSSTNATPIVVTITAHGLVDGRGVMVAGHETNTAANGNWVINQVTVDTFELNNTVGNGIGGATGTVTDNGGVVRLTGTTTGPQFGNVGNGDLYPAKLSGVMNILAIAGTVSPTVTMKYQFSYGLGDWTDLASGGFTAATTIGVKQLNSVAILGAPPFFRWVATITGTSPIFTLSLKTIFHD